MFGLTSFGSSRKGGNRHWYRKPKWFCLHERLRGTNDDVVISTKDAKVGKPVEQYNMLRTFREFLQWRKGDAIILAEANVLPDTDRSD